MGRFAAGFGFAIITMFVWSAFGGPLDKSGPASLDSFVLSGGVTPSGNYAVIKVDEDGRVMCASQ